KVSTNSVKKYKSGAKRRICFNSQISGIGLLPRGDTPMPRSIQQVLSGLPASMARPVAREVPMDCSSDSSRDSSDSDTVQANPPNDAKCDMYESDDSAVGNVLRMRTVDSESSDEELWDRQRGFFSLEYGAIPESTREFKLYTGALIRHMRRQRRRCSLVV